MAKSDAKKRADARYRSKAYTTVSTEVRREIAAQYRAAAAGLGTTCGAVIRAALEKMLLEAVAAGVELPDADAIRAELQRKHDHI